MLGMIVEVELQLTNPGLHKAVLLQLLFAETVNFIIGFFKKRKFL